MGASVAKMLKLHGKQSTPGFQHKNSQTGIVGSIQPMCQRKAVSTKWVTQIMESENPQV